MTKKKEISNDELEKIEKELKEDLANFNKEYDVLIREKMYPMIREFLDQEVKNEKLRKELFSFINEKFFDMSILLFQRMIMGHPVNLEDKTNLKKWLQLD